MTKTIQSPIKWSGSKRFLAQTTSKYFPRNIDVYYKPFIRGGSVLIKVLSSDIKTRKLERDSD